MSDTTLNQFLASGTAADRGAFTPTPPTPASGPDQGYIWYETDTGDTYAWDGSAWQKVNSSSTSVSPLVQQGRLTLETGVPVSTSDQTGKSTLYWTPCDPGLQSITNGNISLYNGSSIVDRTVTQLSLALSGLTSGKNYDVFIDYNSGTPQLVLSGAWSSDTARTDALSTQYDASRKVTVIIKSGTAAYRWVGTIRTTDTTTTEDSAANRFLWNTYNQTRRQMKVFESTASWTYTTATFRQANNSTSNQLSYVTGSALTEVESTVVARAANSSPNVAVAIGTGIDSTSDATGSLLPQATIPAAGYAVQLISHYNGQPGLGYHYLAWLEFSAATGTTTWSGVSSTPTRQFGGMFGSIFC